MKCIKKFAACCTLLSLIPGCFQEQQPPITKLSAAKQRVIQYYEDGSYERDVAQLLTKARNHFDTVQPDPMSVVIFDIDETSISHYLAFKEVDFDNSMNACAHRFNQADAPAVPGMLDFYNYLRDRGFKIIFLTARPDEYKPAAEHNLIRVGYAGYERIIARNEEELKETYKNFKEHMRQTLVNEGYTIAGTVGDQDSDVTGKHTGYTIKLPNYLY